MQAYGAFNLDGDVAVITIKKTAAEARMVVVSHHEISWKKLYRRGWRVKRIVIYIDNA